MHRPRHRNQEGARSMDHRTKRFGLTLSLVALAATGILAMAACSAPPSTEEGARMTNDDTTAAPTTYRTISSIEAQGIIEQGGVTVVDVRTPKEYAEKHIPGAINIPVESIASSKPTELANPDEELLIYCRSGVRSKQAAEKLITLGYRNVTDMGGIIDWHGETVAGSQPNGS